MFGQQGESANMCYLVPRKGYPEVISDPDELRTLVNYFRPYIESGKLSSEMMMDALYNPLNIEYVAREVLHIDCPQGFGAIEMQARLNRQVPCPTCGDMISVRRSEYIELGRCNWDCV